MKTGATKNGYSYEIDPQVLDNMELVDALAEMKSDNDALAISKICRMILGDQQRKALYDHLRTADGRVPVTEVANTIVEIFGELGQPAKN